MKVQSVLILLGYYLLGGCNAQKAEPIDQSVFPDKVWKTAIPEQLGFSSKKLKAAKEQFQSTGGVAGLVVVKGHVIAEWGATDVNLDCRSFRKSLLSSLLGMAISKGAINLDQSLSDLAINDMNRLSDADLRTTVKHLMTSSSGISLSAAFEEKVHRNKEPRGSDVPGEVFRYNNWDFNVLSTIYNRHATMDLFEAFESKVAKPIQMEDFDWRYNCFYIHQPQLSEHSAYLFRISTRDLARFGLLYLNEGRWKDEQIIPREWVLESTSAQIETGEDFYYDYGYLWWVTKGKKEGRRNTFLARGARSQYMFIDPSNEIIIIFRDNPNGMRRVRKSDAYPIIGSVYRAMLSQ